MHGEDGIHGGVAGDVNARRLTALGEECLGRVRSRREPPRGQAIDDESVGLLGKGGIELARANYRMLMERTLPPRVGG